MKIVEVSTRKLLKVFIDLPHKLYDGDPNYVPELYISQVKMLSNKNPFFEHSLAKLYLAMDKGQLVGRIAAIHNRIHNNRFNEKTAFFGFFEAVENKEVFECLINKVIEWAKAQGLNRLMGPANFTTNDSCGFLISGFEKMPVIHMPYNKPYYCRLFEEAGFRKEIDLFAYEIKAEDLNRYCNNQLLERVEDRLLKEGICIRTVQFAKMETEVRNLMEVYNASNADNWGFIPLTENEFRSTANELKSMIPEKLILFAEKDHTVIGFLVALPDFNQVFRHLSAGRLLPTGIFKFLWFKNKIDNARILILGVLKGFKNKGIDILLYHKITENLASLGIHKGEAAYVMENNLVMNSIMHKIGGTVSKKYRMVSLNI